MHSATFPPPTERDQPSSGESGKSYNEEDIAASEYNCTDAAKMRKSYSPIRKISII